MNKHSATWRDERFGCLPCRVPASPVSMDSTANDGKQR
jgi:hypothetical protein